jgi:glutamate/tyrosine decarboxylase-like PLP-dependent enzyme
MRELLESTAQRAISYLEGISNRRVAPSAEAVANLSKLDEPLNDAPSSADEVIKQLDEVCSPATMGMAGPRFFGFVIGGALPVTVAANWLAGAWDQNSGLFTPTPATATLEQVALNWLLDLFKLPADCGGGFVTGATIQADGTCWCGGTVWQGHTAMRISVSSWATSDEDVERSLEAIIRIAKG